MSEQQLLLFGGAAVVLIFGGYLIWRLLGRLLGSGTSLTLLRLVALVGLVVIVGFVVFSFQDGLTQAAAASEVLTPVESTQSTLGSMAVTLDATGSLAPYEETGLTFEIEAPVSEILVKVGDYVQEGDVLARLDTTDAELNLQSAEVALAEAQAAYDALVAEPREIDIKVAEASVTIAQASLASASQGPTEEDIEVARLNYELAKNSLWQKQLSRDDTLATAPEFRGLNARADEEALNSSIQQNDYNVLIAENSYKDLLDDGPDAGSLASASAQLTSAQATLNQLLNGPTETELRQAEIDLETAEMNVEVAQDDLKDVELIAPFDGLVAAEDLAVGAFPPTEDALTLLDVSGFTIELQVDETDVLDVEVGQSVTLDVSALPDTVITGTITKVGTVPSGEVDNLVTYSVEVTLDTIDPLLRPGMSAVATIVLEEVADVVTVPNRFIETDAATQSTVVTVQTGPDTYEKVPVTIGLRNDTTTQIASGLSAGQTVVLFATESTDEEEAGMMFGMPGGGGGGGGGGAPGGGGGPGGGGPPG